MWSPSYSQVCSNKFYQTAATTFCQQENSRLFTKSVILDNDSRMSAEQNLLFICFEKRFFTLSKYLFTLY